MRAGGPLMLSRSAVEAQGERPSVRAVYRARPHEAQGPDARGARRQTGGRASTCAELGARTKTIGATLATGNTTAITAAASAATSTSMAAGGAADVRRYPDEIGLAI